MDDRLRIKPENKYPINAKGDLENDQFTEPSAPPVIATFAPVPSDQIQIELAEMNELQTIRSSSINPSQYDTLNQDFCLSAKRSNSNNSYRFPDQQNSPTLSPLPIRSPRIRPSNKQSLSQSQFKSNLTKEPQLDFKMNTNYFTRIFMVDYFKLLVHIFKVIRKSHRFNPSCLPQLTPKEKIDSAYDRFSVIFFKKAKLQSVTSNQIIFSLMQTFWKQFAEMALLLIGFFGVKIFSSIFIRELLQAISNGKDQQEIYLWTSAICVSVFSVSLFDQHFARTLVVLYQTLRVVLMKHIHSKVTSLSAYTISQNNVGQILNLVSNDLKVLETKTGEILKLPILLLPTISAAVLSYMRFGIYSLMGLSFLVACVPLQAILAKLSKRYFSKRAIFNDQRIQLTNEVLEGIRLIKLYSWEQAFVKMLDKVRETELHLLILTKIVQVLESSISMSSGIVSCFLIFWLVFTFGDPTSLTLANMFSTLDIFLFLRQEVISPSGIGITGLLELKVIMARIGSLLSINPSQMVCINYNEETENQKTEKDLAPIGSLYLQDYSCYWKPDKIVLEDLTVQINEGQLVVIVGPVGCGKSSFLSSFSGEMPLYTGRAWHKGRVALVEQEPFIFNSNIQENIVFGQDFDENLYYQVLDACNLSKDIKLIEGGDLGEVGEKGQNLSGGQRARLSLARAIYSQADIFLLDDPLSALDPRVSQEIFKNAIQGLLKKKTVLLVTHSKDFMKKADWIISLEDGRISQQGTPEELEEYLSGLPSPSNKKKGKLSPSFRGRAAAFSRLPQNEVSQLLIMHQQQQQQLQLDSSRSINNQNASFHSYQFIPEKKQISRPVISKIGISALNLDEGLDVTADVSRQTYKMYFSSQNSILIGLTILLFMSCEVTYIFFTQTIGLFDVNVLSDYPSLILRLGYLSGAYFANTFIKRTLLSCITNKISYNIHSKLVGIILRAQISFFDKTPLASILNNFSSDLSVLDSDLPKTISDSLEVICNTLTLISTIIFLNPIFIMVAAVSAIILGLFFKLSKDVLIQTKQFDISLKSSVFASFNASISGVLPVRIYGQITAFGLSFNQVLNDSLRTSFTYWFSARGFGIYVNFVAQLASISGIFLALIISSGGSNMGSIITFFISLSYKLQSGLRQLIQLDVVMSSAQRVFNLMNLPQEPPLRSSYDKQFQVAVSKKQSQSFADTMYRFPKKGRVEFQNVYMSYREDRNPVLKGVSFIAEANKKVAFVGRTGAGKSSILQALFRMFEQQRLQQTLPSQPILTLPDSKNDNKNEIEDNHTNQLNLFEKQSTFPHNQDTVPNTQRVDTERDMLDTEHNFSSESSIRIDGHLIDDLGIKTLRDGITIIPQVPFLFSGTIRDNIDPLERFSDEQIWNALGDVNLEDQIRMMENGLNSPMKGEQFSAGQKQLICLTRAILKNTKLLVLDEISSNCDTHTEEMIQGVIRKKMTGSTILTIAHRLTTIADYDMIIVLDQGRVIEKGSPFDLLQHKDSTFYSMVESTGEQTANLINNIVQETNQLAKRKKFSVE